MPMHLDNSPRRREPTHRLPPNRHTLHLSRLPTTTRPNKTIVPAKLIPSRSLNLTVRQSATQMNQRPGNKEANQNRSQDAKTVSHHTLALLSVLADVEEGVWVPALGFVGDVCDAEV